MLFCASLAVASEPFALEVAPQAERGLVDLLLLGGLFGVALPAVLWRSGSALAFTLWPRLLASLLLAVPGAVVAARFIALDQDRASPWAYGSAALAGLVALGALAVLARRVPRIFSSFSTF